MAGKDKIYTNDNTPSGDNIIESSENQEKEIIDNPYLNDDQNDPEHNPDENQNNNVFGDMFNIREPELGEVYIDEDVEEVLEKYREEQRQREEEIRRAKEAEEKAKYDLEHLRFVNKKPELYDIEDEAKENRVKDQNDNDFSIFSNYEKQNEDEEKYVNTPTGNENSEAKKPDDIGENPFAKARKDNVKKVSANDLQKEVMAQQKQVSGIEKPLNKQMVDDPDIIPVMDTPMPMTSKYKGDVIVKENHNGIINDIINAGSKESRIIDNESVIIKEDKAVKSINLINIEESVNGGNKRQNKSKGLHYQPILGSETPGCLKKTYPVNGDTVSYLQAMVDTANMSRGFFRDSRQYNEFVHAMVICHDLAWDINKHSKKRNYDPAKLAREQKQYDEAVEHLKETARAYKAYKYSSKEKELDPAKKKLNSDDRKKLKLMDDVLGNRNRYFRGKDPLNNISL
ncbi:hypothetical protein [Butyrivibrio sp. WCD3002]|uniref:hypothetical protein n=1 Tax=Butyrivibrio sp. WCD3002 TaxID=1280676 RepID=UPI00040CB5A1|nr:hypothetical protein [Butyrivibrio sp. WCD3002]